MIEYEITFLVREERDVDFVKELIASFSSEIKAEKKWGKRELAYPIKKERELYYFTYIFEMDPKKVSEFRSKLDFTKEVVRYLLLVVGE